MTDTAIRLRHELWLLRNGAPYKELRLRTSGNSSISMTYDAEIKMCLNCSVEYDEDIDYANDRIEVFMNINNARYPLGRYIITGSTKQSTGTAEYYDLTCMDLTYLAKKTKIESRIMFAAGSKYTDALEQLFTLCGYSQTIIEPSSYTFIEGRDGWDLGTSILEIINDLLAEMNYNSLYMNLEGVICATKYKAPTIDNVTKKYFNDSLSIITPGASIKIDAFDHPNVFYYTCASANTAPINVVAINNRPDNMFSTVRQGRNPVYFNVDSTPSQAALQETANMAMIKSMIAADEISFSTGINPTHNPFEIILLQKKEFSGILEETYWMLKLNTSGLMQHRGRQALYK